MVPAEIIHRRLSGQLGPRRRWIVGTEQSAPHVPPTITGSPHMGHWTVSGGTSRPILNEYPQESHQTSACGGVPSSILGG
jgi:hypothetical protein